MLPALPLGKRFLALCTAIQIEAMHNMGRSRIRRFFFLLFLLNFIDLKCTKQIYFTNAQIFTIFTGNTHDENFLSV